VVRGHGRLAAALLLGEEVVPVDYQDYTSDADELAEQLAAMTAERDEVSAKYDDLAHDAGAELGSVHIYSEDMEKEAENLRTRYESKMPCGHVRAYEVQTESGETDCLACGVLAMQEERDEAQRRGAELAEHAENQAKDIAVYKRAERKQSDTITALALDYYAARDNLRAVITERDEARETLAQTLQECEALRDKIAEWEAHYKV
jgi:hypothetical protein